MPLAGLACRPDESEARFDSDSERAPDGQGHRQGRDAGDEARKSFITADHREGKGNPIEKGTKSEAHLLPQKALAAILFERGLTGLDLWHNH